MPVIHRFSGVDVTIFNFDHPPPHIHFMHKDFNIRFSIAEGDATEKWGRAPKAKTMRRFESWVARNEQVLLEMFALAEVGEPIPRNLMLVE